MICYGTDRIDWGICCLRLWLLNGVHTWSISRSRQVQFPQWCLPNGFQGTLHHTFEETDSAQAIYSLELPDWRILAQTVGEVGRVSFGLVTPFVCLLWRFLTVKACSNLDEGIIRFLDSNASICYRRLCAVAVLGSFFGCGLVDGRSELFVLRTLESRFWVSLTDSCSSLLGMLVLWIGFIIYHHRGSSMRLF